MSNFSIEYNYRLINNFSAAAKTIQQDVRNISNAIKQANNVRLNNNFLKAQDVRKNNAIKQANNIGKTETERSQQQIQMAAEIHAKNLRQLKLKEVNQNALINKKSAYDELKIQQDMQYATIRNQQRVAEATMRHNRFLQSERTRDQQISEKQQQRLAVTSIRAGMLATQVGQIATLGLTVPIVGAFAVGFKFLQESERFQISLRTFLMGNQEMSQKYYKEMFQFAAKTPFQFAESQTVLKQIIGQMPTEVLMSKEGPAKLQETFRQIGTVSALFGVDLTRMGSIYAQVMSKGNFQGMQELRMTRAGVPFAKLAAEAFMIKMPGKFQNIEDAKAAYEIARKNGKVTAEDFKEVLRYITTKYPTAIKDLEVSIWGRLSTLKDYTTAIFGNFADTVLKAVKFDKIITSINEKMGNLVAKIFAGEKGFTKFDAIAMGILASIGPIYMMAGKAFDMIGNFSLAMIGLRLFKQNKWLTLIAGGLKFLGVIGLVLFSIEAIRLAFSFLPDWDKFFPQDKKLAKFAKDTTSLWKNTLTGAGIGAGIGSMFGGIGAIPGALIGATIALVSTGLSQLYASLSEYQWFDDLKSWFAETHKLTVSIWASMPEWLKTFIRMFDIVTPLLGLNKSNEKNPYGYAMLPKFDTTENEKKLYTQYSDQFGLEKTKKALSLGGFFPTETENYKQYSTNSGMLSSTISKQNSLNIKIETEKGLKASSDKKDNGSLSWLGLEIGDYKSDKYGYGV